jgi:hypothetical protein
MTGDHAAQNENRHQGIAPWAVDLITISAKIPSKDIHNGTYFSIRQ